MPERNRAIAQTESFLPFAVPAVDNVERRPQVHEVPRRERRLAKALEDLQYEVRSLESQRGNRIRIFAPEGLVVN